MLNLTGKFAFGYNLSSSFYNLSFLSWGWMGGSRPESSSSAAAAKLSRVAPGEELLDMFFS